MASIRKETTIEAPAADIWDALADFHAVHRRLAAGFVVDSRREDETTRLVTFANGATAREVLVSRDAEARRLVYSVVDSAVGLTHHSASAQVFTDGDHSRFVWTVDLLPDGAAGTVAGLMDHGLVAIKQTVELQAAATTR